MKQLTVLFLASLLTLTGSAASAQKKKDKKEDATTTVAVPATTTPTIATPPVADDFETWQKVYKQAIRYADFSTAAVALNNMISLRPDLKAYKDTLAYVYVELGGSVQALSVAKDVLTSDPGNLGMLEVSAGAQESLGLLKESLEDYEKLYKSSTKPYYLYKVAGLQYYLKRTGECEMSINTLMGNNAIDNEKISISYDRNQRQEVPMRAALYNMQGMLALDKNDFTGARAKFNEALKLDANFALAKGNLQLVDKMEKEKNAPKGTTPKTGGK